MKFAEQEDPIDALLDVWDLADHLSVKTGISVMGIVGNLADFEPFNSLLDSEEAEAIDADDFAAGRIKPTGAVVLRAWMEGECEMFELSDRLSQIVRSMGPEPGSPASLKLQ